MAGENGKKGLDAGTLRILFILGGIVLLALAYFLGFSKFNEKTGEYNDENTKLESEVTKLRGMVAKKAEVEAQTAQYESDTQAIYAKYPSEIRQQNMIELLNRVEGDVKDVKFTTESFEMDQVFFKDGAVLENAESLNPENTDVEGAAPQTISGTAGVKSSVVVDYSADYETIKNVVRFFNENADRTVVPNISISAGEGEKTLECNMEIQFFSVMNQEGKEFAQPIVEGIQAGKVNPFKVN